MIFKNCEENVQSKIETCELASEAWKELREAYEGRTTTKFWTLYEGLREIQFDDRKETIEEHINNFEINWNRFVGIMSRVDESGNTVKGLGKNFLLFSLPTPFYSNTIENIRAKDYTYESVVQKLTKFIPMRSWKNKECRKIQ